MVGALALKDRFEFRVCEWRGGVEQHITIIPIDSHIAFYFPPTSVGSPLSPERETCCMLSFYQFSHTCLFKREHSAPPRNLRIEDFLKPYRVTPSKTEDRPKVCYTG